MNRYLAVYRYSILGALGGLLASYLHQAWLLDALGGPLTAGDRIIWLLALGLTIGASIGFVPSFAEGIGYYSVTGALRCGLTGALFGGLGGLVALPLAEWLHTRLGGGLLGRASALAFLGASIGMAEGINGGARRWRGVVGGICGGIVAGWVIEHWSTFSLSAERGIIPLLSIGFFISALIIIFVTILSDVWLEGLAGSKVAGQVFQLTKFREPHRALIGSDKRAAIFIWVPDAEPTHASVTITSQGTHIHNLSDSGTRVGGRLVSQCLLRDGDVIEVASARFRYHELRSARLVTQLARIVGSGK